MKVPNAVLSSVATNGLIGRHVRADHFRGLSTTMNTTNHDPSHLKLSTIAPHRPTGESQFFDTFAHSNDDWSSATHTNCRHSLNVALGPLGKVSSPPPTLTTRLH